MIRLNTCRRATAGLLLGFTSPVISAYAGLPNESEHKDTNSGKAVKTNILFLIADDLRNELGCYGERHIITPNIDALAAEGTIFNNAFVQYAVSAASRACFLTGCYPETTGVTYPYSEYFVNEFLPTHSSLPVYMCLNGYYTRTLGKVHHGLPEDLTEKHFYPSGDKPYINSDNKKKQGKERPLTEFSDLPDEIYADGKTADETVHTIQRAVKSDKPFFITVGFLKPHLPFVAPEKYLDMYSPDRVPDCPFPVPTENETVFSRSYYNINTFKDGDNSPDSPVSYELSQELRRSYFACVTFIDTQIGKIIDELKKQGVYENTVIILIGDHGWHLGDNAMWGKQTNFERATRAPLIIKNAGKVKKVTALTEFVDIYPTVCELAGIPVPSFVEGASLIPLLHEEKTVWKKAAFSQIKRGGFPGGTAMGYTIRTPQYRYVEWYQKGEIKGRELYDHNIDPLETKNIAAHNDAICQQLSIQLKNGWRAALPDGVTNNSANPVAPSSPGWGPEANNTVLKNNGNWLESLFNEQSNH